MPACVRLFVLKTVKEITICDFLINHEGWHGRSSQLCAGNNIFSVEHILKYRRHSRLLPCEFPSSFLTTTVVRTPKWHSHLRQQSSRPRKRFSVLRSKATADVMRMKPMPGSLSAMRVSLRAIAEMTQSSHDLVAASAQVGRL